MNANYRSKDDADVATEKCKNHPSIKMINENVSFDHVLLLNKYGSLIYKKRLLI